MGEPSLSQSVPWSKGIRQFTILLACTTLTAVLTAARVRSSAVGVNELSSRYDAVGKTVLLVVFRAPDCSLSAELIARLNTVDAASSYKVVGIVLFPPQSATEHEAFVKRLGIRFSTEADTTGVWQRAIMNEGLSMPYVIARTQGRTLGIISPDFLRTLAATGLKGVSLEREK